MTEASLRIRRNRATQREKCTNVHEDLRQPAGEGSRPLHRVLHKLGFPVEERSTDEKAGCLVISDDIYAMLLTEEFFRSGRTFTTKDLADASPTTEAIVALEVDSRQRVDELAGRALESGGSPVKEPMEQDGMYERSFADPDGHLWEVFHVDSATAAAG